MRIRDRVLSYWFWNVSLQMTWKTFTLRIQEIISNFRNGANGSWVDKSQESTATSKQPNVGHNRVHNVANGTWLQAPAMEDS